MPKLGSETGVRVHFFQGRYETIHYFIDHYGNQPRFQKPVAQMQAYLAKHPEPRGV